MIEAKGVIWPLSPEAGVSILGFVCELYASCAELQKFRLDVG